MAGYVSKPIAATALVSNGTANGAVAIASVTGWTIGSQVSLADNTTTGPFYATIVGIITATNTLLLRQDRVASPGWLQLDWPPNSTGQGLPPQLGTNDSKNPTDMSMWLTANSATVAQISTFVYSTLVKKNKTTSGPPKPSSNKVTSVLTSWSNNALNSIAGGQTDPLGGTAAYRVDYQSSGDLNTATIGAYAPALSASVTFYAQIKNQGSSPMSFIIGGLFSGGQRQDFTIPNDGAWHKVGATWTANAGDVAGGAQVLLGNGLGGNANNPSFTGGVFFFYDVEYGPT